MTDLRAALEQERSLLDAMATWPKGANGPIAIGAYEGLVKHLRAALAATESPAAVAVPLDDIEKLAAALHIVHAHTAEPSRRTIPHSHPIAEDYRQQAAAIIAALRDAKP